MVLPSGELGAPVITQNWSRRSLRPW